MIKSFIAFSINSADVNKESLEASLSASPFQPCTSYQTASMGWLSQGLDKFYTRNLGDFVKFTFCIEKRSVPSSVSKAEIEHEVKRFFDRTGSKPNKEERRQIKDEVMVRLLPRAFPKRNIVDIWIDFSRNLFMVGASSYSVTDEVIAFLKSNVRGFDSVSLIQTNVSPAVGMKNWIMDDAPDGFTVDDQCELVMPTENKPTVKFVRHFLDGKDVKDHIVSGKMPVSLSMTYNDTVSFTLTDKLIIKGIKPLDKISESLLDVDPEDEIAMQDAEFLIMASACGDTITNLISCLGDSVSSDSE